MTKRFIPSDALRDDLLNHLPRLKNQNTQLKFLSQHGLLQPEAVSWLTDLVGRQAKVDTAAAVVLAEGAVTIARKLGDPSAMAHSLRAMGNALHISGQNKAAVQQHEKARAIFGKIHDSTELARTWSASIQPLILTGQYKKALSGAEKARQIFRAQKNDWRLARLELNAGNIFHRQDRFAEGLKWYERAYRYFKANPEKDPEAMAVALHNVAMCLVAMNDFPRALAIYNEARSFAERHGMNVLVGQSDYNIALLYHFRGDYSRAISTLLHTREACRKSKDDYHVALCQLDLSEIYLELNQGKQAQEMAEQAAADFQRLGIGYETGRSLVNVALALGQQNKAELALEFFSRARKKFSEEGNAVWPARIDLYKANICLHDGRYLEARKLCLSALKGVQTSKSPHGLISCRLLLARSYLGMGELSHACQQCGTALMKLRKTQIPALTFQAHQTMARLHRAAHRNKDAYRSYQKAGQVFEGLRSGLNREEFKTSFMKNRLTIYEELVELCLERKPRQAGLEEAFGYIEQSKSRALRDLMSKAGSEFQLASDLSPELQHKTAELRAELHWYNHSYETEQLRGAQTSPARLAQIQSEIRKREKALLRMVRELPVSIAESAGLVAPKAATIPEIRAALPQDSTLLEYFQIRNQFVVLLLNHDLLEVVPLGDVSRVNELLVRLQYQFSKFRLGPEYIKTFAKSLQESAQQHLRELHDELIAPIKKYLSGNRLLIVPHGSTHSLPFQALFDGRQYLIDTFSISYAPSATIFSLGQKRAVNRTGGALVLAIPDAAAPLVLDEAKTVAAAISESELFVGESANAKVLREKGAESHLIHIATHGYFRQDDPMFSGIRLGDGLLSLYDLYQLKLPAELITLSGCSTGLSQVADGDELLGLVRGLIHAGARSALLTLWDVHDGSTSEFMASFYRHLKAVMPGSDALRQASLDVRKTNPHPYYWAPFVLIGR